MLHFLNTAGLETFAGNLFLLFIWILKICLCSPPLPPVFPSAVSIPVLPPHTSPPPPPKVRAQQYHKPSINTQLASDTRYTRKTNQKEKKRIKDVWPQEKGLKETPTWVKPRSVAEHRQQHEQLILMPESAIPEHHLVFCASLLATTLVVIRQS